MKISPKHHKIEVTTKKGRTADDNRSVRASVSTSGET
ncbi:hypothetical protein UACE39S_03473 [Ureibacillus acetophenoni]